MNTITSRQRAAGFAAALALLGGCASTRLDAQWTDPQFAGTSLGSARVLVACEAREPVVQRLCEDRIAAEVVARGASPVLAKELGGNPGADTYAPAARSIGARAALVVAITSQVPPASSGSGVSIGIGGFGGGGSSRGGVGVGMSMPVGGGGPAAAGHAANSRLIDAATGRLMWTARATTPASQNLDGQLRELATATLEAAEKSGFF